jgi:heat shock protein HtpX
MQNIYEVQQSNKIKSGVITALFLVFSFIAIYILGQAFGYYMGYDVGGLGYIGIAFIVSGISTFISYYNSDKIVLSISGARPANKEEDKIFKQVGENLSIGTGLPLPKLYVIEDTAPNAFATGRDPEHAVVCVTSGLLSKLNRSELEAVVAHEMGHIKNYDIRLMSIVSVMVGLVALLADWLLHIGMRTRGRRDESGNAGAIIVVLGVIFALISPIIATMIQLAISRRREFFADSEAVMFTRNPQGLINALTKISNDHEPLEAANKATAHLYIVTPFKDKVRSSVGMFANLFNTHPPIKERIQALQKMS